MKKKRCIICNRPYNHHYDLFGRSCLANLYTQLNISNSRLISNKEKHLCNVIARRHLKFFLGKEKKYALAENYIALDYLKRIDLKFTEDIKNLLKENITRISVFNKYLKSMLPIYSLNDFYKIYNDYMEFKKLLNENISDGKKDFDETILKGFAIIFDIDKITMPLYYSAFYEMQRMFWEIIVISGLLADMKLSADSVPMSIFSSTLNNFAAISSSYNVIKPFNFKLKIKNDDFKIENMK